MKSQVEQLRTLADALMWRSRLADDADDYYKEQQYKDAASSARCLADDIEALEAE
jgi:hypothetical protein